jgi:hypothetical protein
VDITATASIESKWHVYALKVSNDPNAIGPIPTELKLTAASTYTKSGGTKEGLKYITHFDPNFEMDLNYYENKAVFIQRIKRKSPAAFDVAGVLEYMACDESKCIFPDPVKFTVKIAEVGAKEEVVDEASTTASEATSGILAPVKWSVNSVKVEEGVYDIIFTANIDQNWHLYSQFLPSNEGPVATTFKIEAPANVQLVEGVKEGAPTKKYDPNFMMDVNFFSGKTSFMNESSPAEPVNMYGKSKLESEASVLKENENALIIRTNFYGWGTSYRQSFSDYIIKALRAKREIKLFQDVYYTPILAKYLINSVHKLVDMKSNGIFNIVGDTRLSKFEFGVKLAKEFGLDHALIKPINFQANQNALARRPLDMSLSNKKVSDLIGHTMGTADEHLHELHRQEGYGMATELGVL